MPVLPATTFRSTPLPVCLRKYNHCCINCWSSTPIPHEGPAPMNIESHARDAAGHSIERRTGEVGGSPARSRGPTAPLSHRSRVPRTRRSRRRIFSPTSSSGETAGNAAATCSPRRGRLFRFVDRIGDTCQCRPSAGMAAVPLVRRSKEAGDRQLQARTSCAIRGSTRAGLADRVMQAAIGSGSTCG
jgi:hypothetical protein